MSSTISANHLVGYACQRVDGQSLQAQITLLAAAGCSKIYCDQITTSSADRTDLRAMIENLAAGEIVLVTSIDRFARCILDFHTILKQIVDAGAGFRSLAEPWADTGAVTGPLMLSVVEGLAHLERNILSARLLDGRSRAYSRGERTGRKPSLSAEEKAELANRRAEGATLSELAESFKTSMTTVHRYSRTIPREPSPLADLQPPRSRRAGRPPLFTVDQTADICRRRESGATLAELAQIYRTSIMTVHRLTKKAG